MASNFRQSGSEEARWREFQRRHLEPLFDSPCAVPHTHDAAMEAELTRIALNEQQQRRLKSELAARVERLSEQVERLIQQSTALRLCAIKQRYQAAAAQAVKPAAARPDIED